MRRPALLLGLRSGEAVRVLQVTEAAFCAWCQASIPLERRRGTKFCSTRCRQASWRFKIGRAHQVATDTPMRFAYADPPYPGKAFYYPERQEVDHASLIDRLDRNYPDGWALSTSSRSLRDVLPLCPPTARVCAWFKGPRPTKSRRALMSWEPLIVVRGRTLQTASPQALSDGLIAQGRFRALPGAMIGMKPPAFAEWMFRQLGAQVGDELDDIFPGSGAIRRAWIRAASLRDLSHVGGRPRIRRAISRRWRRQERREMGDAARGLAANVSERELQDTVIEMAQRLGWLVAHFRPAKTEKGWRTPVEADGKGFPDLVLVRVDPNGGRVIFAELKREGEKPNADQRMWLGTLKGCRGVETFVWRPSDLDAIEEALR